MMLKQRFHQLQKLFFALGEKYNRAIWISAGAFFITLFLMNLEFNLIESSLYDFRMRFGFHPKTSGNIALIAIDEKTLKKLDEFAPLPLDQHVRLFETLEISNPKAIGYLVDLNRVHQAYPELTRGVWGTRLVGVASRLDTRGVPVILGIPFDVNGEVIPPYPISAIPHSVAMIHKDGNVFGEDKITRRALLRLYNKPVFHLELAQRLGYVDSNPQAHVRGQFSDSNVDADYFFFRYFGETNKDAPYPVYSFIDVLEGKVGEAELAGKTVLVGTLSRDNSDDFTFTPYSKNNFTNPKLVVHANILDSIIQQRGIIRAPSALNWICTFLVTLFVIWSVFTYTPLYGVFNTITLAFGFILVGQILFSVRGLWIREAQPLVGIFLAYYLAVPYRLIQEYQRRWDYQRKNEILVQVEELKTNFLRLVTHDLKTPVARIQGLAEMALRKLNDSASLATLMAAITSSTEELNHFITSVLELTKLESNQITLNIESKDINQLVERTMERFQTQASEAGIKVEMELEPLFPIKMDASLISKVLSNIIDNAIKYSPKESAIHIRTRELGEFIEVSIADQGIGMTEQEVESLFTRFYRAKNDVTASISGTGLGLYLTKFFVEAHHGRVEVQSAKDHGSVFKIYLPTHLSVKPGLTVMHTKTSSSKEKTHV